MDTVLKCAAPGAAFSGPHDPGLSVLRSALTVLVSLRSFRLPLDPDYAPIESPPTVEIPEVDQSEARRFWRDIGVSLDIGRNRARVR